MCKDCLNSSFNKVEEKKCTCSEKKEQKCCSKSEISNETQKLTNEDEEEPSSSKLNLEQEKNVSCCSVDENKLSSWPKIFVESKYDIIISLTFGLPLILNFISMLFKFHIYEENKFISLILATIIVVVALPKKIYTTYLEIKSRKFSHIILQVFAIVSVYIYSSIVVLFNINMKFDFDCLPFILIIFAISEIIENKVISNIKNNISEQTKITKQTKVIVKNNKIEKLVWQNDLKQGEIFYLKNGQQLTVDSKLISENGVFDTSAISGESKPYIANKNDEVLSGSINNGQIQKLQVINIHENSLVANLDKELQKLQAKETPMFILGQKFLQAILITIIVVAILNFSISLPLFGIQHAILTSIAIILITCPCGIAAGLPLLFSIYMSELLKNKILVRDLLFIEYVQKIKAFAFDKTGTITTSTPDVYEIKGETKYNKYIYGIEKFSTHPIAKSICNYLKSYESSNLEFTKIEEKVGKGIEAKIEDKIFNIGSKKYLDQLQIEITSSTEDQNLAKKGFIIIYVVCNKKITNKIILNSKLIPGVKNLMQNLNTIGKTYLITGDNSEVGEYIAKKANIWKTYSNVTPMEKLNVIKKIQQDSLVLYTGDGINDSLSLRQANLSISFSNGSDVAKQNANALLLKQDISLIWKLLNFSKKTVNNMYLSMWITYIYNLITMLLAILSVVSLEFAPFAEVVSVFIIIVNVYRLKLSSNKVFSKN